MITLIALVAGANRATAQSMELSSTTINFGSAYVTLSASRTLTIKNTGTAALTLSKVTVSGPFSSGTLDVPKTIEPGASSSATLWFDPKSVGNATGTLSISSNASTEARTVSLSGTGLAQTFTLTPSSVDLTGVAVGSTATQTETFKNTGTTSLDLYKTAISGTGFSLTGITTPVTIAAGKSISFSVRFAPESAGTVSGTATFFTSMEGSLKLPLSGTAVSGTLTASPSSLSFGDVDTDSSASKTVSVENTGSSTVSVSSVTMSGSGYATTGLSAGEKLAVGQSATLTVVFAPATASTSSGDITITSNASNATLTIGLSGTGVQSSQPWVTLSWTASTSSVAGYNVYRSTVSGGPYTILLNSSLVTGLSYTDSTVEAGVTYYYVVVAVSASGVESSYSNQASATVPVP
jgi:Abnormal spindle-like microcephaly-assoc'd, ASPM-SPD-2-Hydin/Protein of unknown function (DUF1573)